MDPKFKAEMNKDSDIRKVIGVISGKGGVGKSFVTAMLAVEHKRRGCSTAVLDSDVTGPSIPKMFGLTEKAKGNKDRIYPVESKTGIKIISSNLLLENDTDPVIWRGPLISSMVKQFWTNVVWGDVDQMFIDMPPGTGDVALTIFQSIPLDGIIIVASPQELVNMIVAKAFNMAYRMNVPVLGIIENMAYFKCPGCSREYEIFGESRIEAATQEFDIELLGRIPVDPQISKACDDGRIETLEGYLDIEL